MLPEFKFFKTDAERVLEDEDTIKKLRSFTYIDEQHQYSIEDIVNTWRLDIEKDYDIVCVITGYEGSGKSTFAVLLAETCRRLFNYDYAFPKNPYEFLNALNDDKCKLIIVDEAVANLYSRNAMSSENKQFVSMLTMCRSKNKIMLFLIPRIRNIDIYLRADRVFQWFEIRERNNATNEGTALFFMRNNNDFASVETFDMKSISYAIQRSSALIFKTKETERILRENLFYYVQSYIGHIRYTVTDDIKKKTREYSERLKRENLEIAERDMKDFYINKAIAMLKKKLAMIQLAKAYSKITKRHFTPNITVNDNKAYSLLKNYIRNPSYPFYDFTPFSKDELMITNELVPEKVMHLDQEKLLSLKTEISDDDILKQENL